MSRDVLHNIIVVGTPARPSFRSSYAEPLLARCMLDRVMEVLIPKWTGRIIDISAMTADLKLEVYQALIQQIEMRGLMQEIQAQELINRVDLKIEQNSAVVIADAKWCQEIDDIFHVDTCPRCRARVPVPWAHESILCDEQICHDVLET